MKVWSSQVVDVITSSGPLSAPVRRFPEDVANKTRLSDVSWGILVTRPVPIWDLSIRRSGSTFRFLRISQLRNLLRSVKSWTLCKNTISAACSWDYALSVISLVTTGKDRNIGRFKTDNLAMCINLSFWPSVRYFSRRFEVPKRSLKYLQRSLKIQ